MSLSGEKALQKARQLLTEADRKLSSKSFLEVLFGSSNARIEKAIEFLEKAGNLFKLSKNWKDAGDTFIRAANLSTTNRHEAASCLVNAGICYKRYDPNKAVNCLLKAIELYTDMGRFSLAASNHERIAQIYETELNDMRQVVEHYEQAADYYRSEESYTAANKCLIKAAQYYSDDLQDYQRALSIYEEVAKCEIRSTLLKYNVKTYFFKAALCLLCTDVVSAQSAIERYVQLFPAFADSREYKLLKNILQCFEDNNVDGFTKAVSEYDSVSRLEPWYVTMLLRAKEKFNERPSIC